MKEPIFSRKERILSIILVILTIVMLLATAVSMYLFRSRLDTVNLLSRQDQREYQEHYALIVDDPEDPLWDSVYEEMLLVGDSQDVYVEMFGKNLSQNFTKTELLRIAIESHVDGIILEADEDDITTSLIYKANHEGIPVVTILHDCVGSGRVSFVGINNYSFGTEYGNLITKAATEIRKSRPDKNEITDASLQVQNPVRVLILLDGQAIDASQRIIYTAIQEMLEGEGQTENNLEITTERIESSSVFRTEEKIRDIILNSENLPDIIVCLNEQNTSSVYQMLVDQNKVGQIYVIGYFDSESILKAIDRGGIYATVSIDTAKMSKYSIDALHEYIETGYVSDYFSVDFTCVDKSNVASYIRKEDDHEID